MTIKEAGEHYKIIAKKPSLYSLPELRTEK